jgi:hypothetical protein
MSAVNARIYYSMKKEFLLLKNIIRDYSDPNYQYDPSTGTPGAKQSDYNKVNLIPVADPNAATMAQKVVQYQAVMQMAQQNPDIYDLPELNKQMLEVLGVKNINKLIPDEDNVKQTDPVSENMNIINGKPVKAFLDQDHEAHIAVHMAFAEDPKIRQLVGQSSKAKMIESAMESHIAEHVAFLYRIKIEEQLGVPLPPVDEPLPVDVENEIARLSAAGADKLLQSNKAEASQQKAQQQEQDPIIQMQKAELEIKKQESQVKAEKTKADIQLDIAKLELEREKATVNVERDITLAQAKIASAETIVGANIGAKAEMEQKQIQTKEVLEGARLGAAAINKQKDINLREKESKLRNETTAHKQKLKDETQVKETKLKDETKLNDKE